MRFDWRSRGQVGFANRMTQPLAELCYAAFADLLHSSFRVRDAAPAPVELELTEATVHGSERERARARTFSLVFTGPLDRFLPQRTYVFEQEKLGAFPLFIVPIGKDQKSFRYEAVFNRPVRADTPQTDA